MEQNPHILNALLPLQQNSNDTSSIVINQEVNEPSVTGQPVSEVMVASQMISIEQKVNKSIDNQEDIKVMASQSVDEVVNAPFNSSLRSNQESGEVIDVEETDVDQSVKEEATDQGVSKSQESNDVASIEETSEAATNLGANEAVNTQETFNTQETVNSQDAGYAQAATHSEDVLPLTSNSQDMILGDLMDTPHHKTLLDLWQHSFVLTYPSCVDCSSEARLLWHEPVMDKTPTHPLQHYTSSVNSDQVSSL